MKAISIKLLVTFNELEKVLEYSKKTDWHVLPSNFNEEASIYVLDIPIVHANNVFDLLNNYLWNIKQQKQKGGKN